MYMFPLCRKDEISSTLLPKQATMLPKRATMLQKNVNNVEATFDYAEKTKFYDKLVRHCCRFWQQSRMECCFDKVQRCFDIVAGVEGALKLEDDKTHPRRTTTGGLTHVVKGTAIRWGKNRTNPFAAARGDKSPTRPFCQITLDTRFTPEESIYSHCERYACTYGVFMLSLITCRYFTIAAYTAQFDVYVQERRKARQVW